MHPSALRDDYDDVDRDNEENDSYIPILEQFS